MSITAILGFLLIFAYIFFYLQSRQYLRHENFESGITVSWPGGVVSPPPFGASAFMRGY